MSKPSPPLLITLKMNESAFTHFNALRLQHFPPAHNRFEAHITLFHWLSGHQRNQILTDLQMICTKHTPFKLHVEGVWQMREGVAYRLQSDIAEQIYGQLLKQWNAFLDDEERQRPFIPHITVQNGVKPIEAASLHEVLSMDFTPSPITAIGFDVWHMQDGAWQWEQTLAF